MEKQFKLILMRHGKAEQANLAGDHARQLLQEGKEEAYAVALKLKALGWAPDLIIASDAKRAEESLHQVLRIFGKAPFLLEPSYYSANSSALTAHLLATNNLPNFLMLIGHNPTWSELAMNLSSQPIGLKTSYTACLSCIAKSWHDALNKTWEIVNILDPF